MNRNSTIVIMVILGLIIVVLGGYIMGTGSKSKPDTVIINPGTTTNNTGSPVSTSNKTLIQIPLILLDDNGKNGDKVGCGDSLIFVPVEVNKTVQVLNAVYQQITNKNDFITVGGKTYTNAVATQFNSNGLRFDRAAVENGVARVYFTGKIVGVGTCYEPRLTAQLQGAALQFPTVKSVRIFLNGTEWDASKFGDESGGRE